jgi:hypothetical protein
MQDGDDADRPVAAGRTAYEQVSARDGEVHQA